MSIHFIYHFIRYEPGEQLRTSCGSLAYSAPEILLGDAYDAPAVGQYKERYGDVCWEEWRFVFQKCLIVTWDLFS